MLEANVHVVLNRFKEIMEGKMMEEAGWKYVGDTMDKKKSRDKFSFTSVLSIFEKSHKQVMRELCLTGCPYGKIWECKIKKEEKVNE